MLFSIRTNEPKAVRAPVKQQYLLTNRFIHAQEAQRGMLKSCNHHYAAILLCGSSGAKWGWIRTVGRSFLGEFVWSVLVQRHCLDAPATVCWESLLWWKVNLNNLRSEPFELMHGSSISVSLVQAICPLFTRLLLSMTEKGLLSGPTLSRLESCRTPDLLELFPIYAEDLWRSALDWVLAAISHWATYPQTNRSGSPACSQLSPILDWWKSLCFFLDLSGQQKASVAFYGPLPGCEAMSRWPLTSSLGSYSHIHGPVKFTPQIVYNCLKLSY